MHYPFLKIKFIFRIVLDLLTPFRGNAGRYHIHLTKFALL